MKKKIIIVVSIILVIVLAIVLILVLNKKEEPVKTDEETKVIEEIKLIVDDKELIVKLEKNLTSDALLEKLDSGDITIDLEEYGGFEKVGDLGFKLPRADKYLKTSPGDVILYNGNQITIHYGTNTWNYTKIGKITNVNEEELKEVLGEGNVTIRITK